ncbi:hypothetical protein [Natronorubrum sp. FCH18a]|uniref:hypothetical protein n=1 Tax=Natronorubrum sp. FCH18a TaxID=3447018 RepID=UPI003F516EA3
MTGDDATGGNDIGTNDALEDGENVAAEDDANDETEPGDPRDAPAADDRTDGVARRLGTLLERVRTQPRPHAVATLLAVGLGLLLSWLHWFGLVLGGALVALVAPTLRRGVVGAIGFGVVVLVAFALALGSSAGAVLEMTPVVYLVVASAIGMPVLGSLVRGLE